METPPSKPSVASVLNFDFESPKATMSPITNLAHNLSSLSTTMPRTPTRRISWSNPVPSPISLLTKDNSSSDSPISTDSPMFQEGVLKGMRDRKKNRPFSSQKIIGSPINRDKESKIGNDSSITIEQPLLTEDGVETDSPDDFSGGSQESGFVDHYSYASQSSVVSVRSSVFTDEELEDDEDSMFAVDKFVEDEHSSEIPSSMSQLITGPLSITANQGFKFTTSEISSSKGDGMYIRRCLSMSTHRFNQNTPISSRSFLEEETAEGGQERLSKFAFKRPEPLDRGITPLQSKRRKSSPLVVIPQSSSNQNKNQAPLVRCYSETAATIMKAVQKSVTQPDLIGDCSKPFALPLIQGRHPDLKSITGETLMKLLNGEFSSSIKEFLIVDCRYPYEYSGGHIMGAKNIYTKDEIFNTLLTNAELAEDIENRNIIVFHCEFSSERAPKLLRFLRNKDRELNEDAYPRLHHPEIYILEGGYKAFYQEFKDFCEPQEYKPMLHKDHADELKEFQKEGKSKIWGKLRETQNRFKTRKFNHT